MVLQAGQVVVWQPMGSLMMEPIKSRARGLWLMRGVEDPIPPSRACLAKDLNLRPLCTRCCQTVRRGSAGRMEKMVYFAARALRGNCIAHNI